MTALSHCLKRWIYDWAPSNALALIPASFIINFLVLPLFAESFLDGAWQLAGFSGESAPFIAGAITQQLAMPIGWFVWFALLTQSRHRAAWQQALGLHWQATAQEKWWQVAWLILFQGVMVLVFSLVSSLWFPQYLPSPWAHWPAEAIPFLVVIAVAVAPLLEEWVFRGWLQGVVKERLGVDWSLIASSGLFTLFHVGYFQHLHALIYVFGLGVLYAYWREKTGSVWPGVVAHAINNALALSLIFA